MARAPKTPKRAPPANGSAGDNSEEKAKELKALRIYHVTKLREQDDIVAAAKAILDTQRQIFTDLCRHAKGDTRIERQEFTALLKDMKRPVAELVEREKTRASLRIDWDMPVGYQADLFDTSGKADDAWAAGVGFAMGRRGDECKIPDTMDPAFAVAFTDGWHKGKEEHAWAMAEAGRIIDRRKQVAGLAPAKPQGDSSDDEPPPPPDPMLQA